MKVLMNAERNKVEIIKQKRADIRIPKFNIYRIKENVNCR